jgi:hypothetical protein
MSGNLSKLVGEVKSELANQDMALLSYILKGQCSGLRIKDISERLGVSESRCRRLAGSSEYRKRFSELIGSRQNELELKAYDRLGEHLDDEDVSIQQKAVKIVLDAKKGIELVESKRVVNNGIQIVIGFKDKGKDDIELEVLENACQED